MPTRTPTVATADAGVGDDGDLLELGAAVDRLARSSRREGLALMRKKDYPAALRELTKVYELIRDDPEVMEQLARLHALLGDREQAESFYREALALAPTRASTNLALAELWLSEPDRLGGERLAELDTLLTRAQRELGSTLAVQLAMARAEAARDHYEEAARLYERLLTRHPNDAVLALEVGDFHRDFARYPEALRAYRKVEGPAAMVRQAAQRIFELDVQRQARALGFGNEREDLPSEVTRLLARARVAMDRNDFETAEARLHEAVGLAPAHALARGALGAFFAERGKPEQAELALLQALALSSGSAEYLLALADLYTQVEPRRDDEAARFLRRALVQRPDRADLLLRLARVQRRRGQLRDALAQVRRYLQRASAGEVDPEAYALREELERALGVTETNSGDSGGKSGPRDGEARAAAVVARARAHLQRGATDAALVVLGRVPAAQRTPELALLHSRILQASGRDAEAADVLRRLLQRKPDAPVRLELAEVLERAGAPREARSVLLAAEKRGAPAATLALAERDLNDTGVFALVHAYRRASRLLGDADAAESHGPARRVLRQARAGLARRFGWLLGGLLLPVVGFLVLRRVRHGGIDLRALVERHPEAGPELQRILSALRHEVLKHNTMMLTGLSEALSRGEPAGDHGRHLVRALFGAEGVPGAHDRLLTYGGQLEQLGRAHGERVNLWRRDPVLSSLAAGMQVLQQVAPDLARIDRLGKRRRARVAAAVADADEWLNQEGYSQLRQLLDQVRVYTVTETAVRAVFERVRSEPGLAALPIQALVLEADDTLPCTVDMPQAAFEDVLANLMRNALQASARAQRGAGDPLVVGLAVHAEMDPITALSRVLFQVRDQGDESLDVEQLRGHYIEQGLGLTADLVARFQGSLEVRAERAPWTKAVVLALPISTEDAYDPE